MVVNELPTLVGIRGYQRVAPGPKLLLVRYGCPRAAGDIPGPLVLICENPVDKHCDAFRIGL